MLTYLFHAVSGAGQAAKIQDSVSPKVDEYLYLLQERNRFMRTIQGKTRQKVGCRQFCFTFASLLFTHASP